jgi:hypothetical protein
MHPTIAHQFLFNTGFVPYHRPARDTDGPLSRQPIDTLRTKTAWQQHFFRNPSSR